MIGDNEDKMNDEMKELRKEKKEKRYDDDDERRSRKRSRSKKTLNTDSMFEKEKRFEKNFDIKSNIKETSKFSTFESSLKSEENYIDNEIIRKDLSDNILTVEKKIEKLKSKRKETSSSDDSDSDSNSEEEEEEESSSLKLKKKKREDKKKLKKLEKKLKKVEKKRKKKKEKKLKKKITKKKNIEKKLSLDVVCNRVEDKINKGIVVVDDNDDDVKDGKSNSYEDRLLKDISVEVIERAKAMAPMTKEEWEKKQSVVRRVYDEESGRHRLIKGDGEILEEIVSRDRHREINKQATRGDGEYFQSRLKLRK